MQTMPLGQFFPDKQVVEVKVEKYSILLLVIFLLSIILSQK